MTDTAVFRITLDGEEGSIGAVLNALKSRFKSDVADLQSTASKLDLFGKVTEQSKIAEKALTDARAKVVELQEAVSAFREGGADVSGLEKSLKAATKEADNAKRAFDQGQASLVKLDAQLKVAGVDTTKFATEQVRLAEGLRQAAAAATDQQAKQALGLRTLSDTRAEVANLYAAYNTLRSSGTVSVRDLALAQTQLKARIQEVRASVTGVQADSKNAGDTLAGMFQKSILPALGLASASGAVLGALKASTAASKEYAQGIAEIGTVTNLSKSQLEALGSGARAIAKDLGLDLTGALRGLFELIRSGVPEDNALEVLRLAAVASKASLAELGDGIKAANVLLDAFGVNVSDLGPALDKVVQGAKDGGATLKEFADGAAPLLAVARAANVPLDELVATLTVLTDKSGSADKAIGDLTKIIRGLDTAQARERLHDLGIESDGLIDTFTKLGERGLSLDKIVDLGIVSGKSAAGIASLTLNARELAPELDKIATSGGAAADGLTKLLDSPKQRAERFNAELHEAAVNIGNLVGSGSSVARVGTAILASFNLIPKAFRDVDTESTKNVKSFSDYVAVLFQTVPAAGAASTAAGQAAGATAAAAKAANDAAVAYQRATRDLGDFSNRLTAEIAAIQQASARDIADANARAEAQIAALDRSVKATKETADTTLAIEVRLAADRLAIISKADVDTQAALAKSVAAREAAARKAGESEAKIANDSAAQRIAALAPVLAQYQQHYAALVQQAQGFAAKQQSIESERIDFNKSVEKTLFDIRLSGLSVFDQYAEKSKEVDRLISEARKAGLEGDIQAAKKFTEEAISLAGSLKKETDENGNVIVTQLQAQTTATTKIKEAAAGYNAILADQAAAAKEGADATKKGIDDVLPLLITLRDKYDGLKASVAEGLDVKVRLDEASVSKALATLDQLKQPMTTTLTVEVTKVEKNATGGAVGLWRKFASGGAAFPRLSSSHVPGQGDGDTVPAALQAGSFVVRKAASQYYGPGIMGRLAQGFASGGSVGFGMGDRSSGFKPNVTQADVRRYAAETFGFDPFSSQVYDPGKIGQRTDAASLGTAAPVIDPRFGFRSGDSFQTNAPPISFDTRPIPEDQITAANVITYAREMLNSVNQSNPLLGDLRPAILDGIHNVEAHPTDLSALKDLLQAAETIGANPYVFAMWGKTTGSPASAKIPQTWFIDWLNRRGAGGGKGGGQMLDTRAFSGRFFQAAIERAGNPLIRALQQQRPSALQPLSPSQFIAKKFAAGGDVVPAMLTPGEWVINPRASAAIGHDVMSAINAMQISPGVLRDALSPRAPVRHFSEGGQVTAGASVSPASAPASGGVTAGATVTNQITLQIRPSDEDFVRRVVIPAIDKLSQRTR